MGFYEQISQYYDYIFPTGDAQVKFIKNVTGQPPKAVLDVACGTGGYSLALAKEDYHVVATDLDAKMVQQLDIKANKAGTAIRSLQADMLEIGDKITNKFDTVFCIGNSIVHLKNLLQIKSFLINAKKLLNDNGSLILQIINFDRVLAKDIKSLPTITDESIGLSFERNYRYSKDQNIVYFKTKLTVREKSFESEIPLYPLLENELIQAITQAGFKDVKLFGDFEESKFEKYDSFMLVLWAK